MSLTMSTIRELSNFDGTISDCAGKASNVILRAARGNSGAILSLFFRGMSKSLRGLDIADTPDIAAAFRRGTEEAYKAVMKPTEGTILSVMRACDDAAEATWEKYRGNILGFFEHIVAKAEVALAKTPEQLPVLKEVNVVDAGGYGFVVILKGMLAALKNQPVVAKDASLSSPVKVFEAFDSEEITFTYCTECIVEKSEAFLGEGHVGAFREFILGVGDSAVFVDDEEIIKLHVHTNNPGSVMEEALKYGALATVKVENMRKQHSEIISAPTSTPASAPVSSKPQKKYSFVTVCMGGGIANTFSELGADKIVFGGQTMNPSTQDIIDGINACSSEEIFVLPNNKNIYMVAEQAAKLVEDKKVYVLPTRSVPQGISAMLVFDESVSAQENLEAMNEALSGVTSASITQACRDTTLDGEKIENGQYLGLVNGDIFCVENSPAECLEKLAALTSDRSFITVFYGEGITEDRARSECECLKASANSFAEFNLLCGDQPLYPYIISIE